MEWLARLNEAVAYLEENLDGEIDLNTAAQKAVCSPFHFQRMFTYLCGIPLGEYLRRRRMSMAAGDLLTTDERVIDIALKYGYDSPTAFSRAFHSVHGMSPSEARKEGASVTAFPRITFTLSIKGEQAMNYRIEKRDAFRVVGAKLPLSNNTEENFADVPAFWQKTVGEGLIEKLCPLMDGTGPQGILGVCSCMQGKDYAYYICVASNRPAPASLAEYTVPAATWAIFTSVGANPNAIQSLQKQIVSEWLPSSGYEYADAPDVEVYFEGDQSAADYKCEAWLPVTKAK
ncbi:MAG: AraC family transcriptional regulator [Eubacteriales bacterium]|nr:AraC family transcriptional regulator [Eubacteriales bacterium]